MREAEICAAAGSLSPRGEIMSHSADPSAGGFGGESGDSCEAEKTGGLVSRVEDFSLQNSLFSPGDACVLGVSGGADSTALLLFFCAMRRKYRLRLTVVHVHHGIRGAEADADVSAVRQLCARQQVELLTFFRDIPREAAAQGLTEEEAGRRARYEIFENVRRQKQAAVIAVAHHRDDQAELVLMNLIRGTGIRGMGGMRPKSGAVIRPFLCVGRAEIEGWLRECGQPWRTDSTNADDRYTRNAVRHRILPALDRIRPHAAEHIAAAAEDFRQADDFFRREADRRLDDAEERLCRPGVGADSEEVLRRRIADLLEPHTVVIPEALLARSDLEAAYAVMEGIRRLGAPLKDLSRAQIRSVCRLGTAGEAAFVRLTGGVTAYREYGSVRLVREAWDGDGPTESGTITVRLTAAAGPAGPETARQQNLASGGCIALLDYDKISGAICLRCRRHSDRFSVNRDGSGKKLKDVMIDLQLPARLRSRWPLLASGNEILWIPGFRVSPRYFVSGETRSVLRAELLPGAAEKGKYERSDQSSDSGGSNQ